MEAPVECPAAHYGTEVRKSLIQHVNGAFADRTRSRKIRR